MAELLEAMEAFGWREKRQREIAAWLIQMLGQWKEGQRPTIAELMGEDELELPRKPTREELLKGE